MKPHEAIKLDLQLDRTYLGKKSELPSWVIDTVRENELATTSRVSFCGLMMKGSSLQVFLPRNSSIPDNIEEKQELAVLLISAVERYSRNSSTKVYSENFGSNVIGGGLLTLARTILEDYKTSGLYSQRHRKSVLNSGKINWRSTFNNETAIRNKSGRPVYITLRGEKSQYSSMNEVALIHESIVKYLDDKFGWWLTKNTKSKVTVNLSLNDKLISNKRYCLQVLSRELQISFTDRNVRLIRSLMSFFEVHEGDTKSPFVIGLKSFHFAWEAMLSDVLTDTTSLNRQLPIPVYMESSGNEAPLARSKMRTDIILKQKNKIVVVDAKYYSAASITGLPGWGDLVKQFFYAKALEIIRPKCEVGNVFIFPKAVEFVSAVRVKDITSSDYLDEDFPKINCIYVDPLIVMKNYVSRSKMSQFTDTIFSSTFNDSHRCTPSS